MSIVVKNIGARAYTAQGSINTVNPVGATGDQGTVRVVYELQEYVWGPNESKTLEDGIAQAVVAADARLKIVDTVEGWQTGQAVT